MSVKVGHLYRKRTVRDLSGNIIDLRDEANGGIIISKGQVVNQVRLDEMAKVEEDKRIAATASLQVTEAPKEVQETRVVAPNKVETLEKEVAGIKNDISAILELLKKNDNRENKQN